MTAAEWSVGAAGPVLRLVADNDTHGACWQDFALCREFDGDLWFMERGDSGYGKAKSICGACPVREMCLEYALAMDSGHMAFGVYGGKSPGERRAIARKRKRQAKAA